MFKYLFISFLSLYTGKLFSQTTVNGSFLHGGINRTYSFYIPASYIPGTPVPMVIGLHGLASSGSDFAQYRDFRSIADTANFIVVHPDGSTMLGLKYWNYGSIVGSTVDDVGFLEALIDTISAHYNINQQRIYCAGMSNGSFMSYYMACQSNRFAAIGCVTGSMSVNMYNTCNPQRAIPVIHIHGTDDSTNPYAGNSSMKGIEEVTRFWIGQNNCHTIPQLTAVPDISSTDGATAQRYLYSGGVNGHTVELFKITGGGHSWPGSPMPGSSEVTCMDFSATAELWRFFSQFDKTGVLSTTYSTAEVIDIWPNPCRGDLYVKSEKEIKEVHILDMQGRTVIKKANENNEYLNLHHLASGNYILKMSGSSYQVTKKLIIQQ